MHLLQRFLARVLDHMLQFSGQHSAGQEVARSRQQAKEPLAQVCTKQRKTLEPHTACARTTATLLQARLGRTSASGSRRDLTSLTSENTLQLVKQSRPTAGHDASWAVKLGEAELALCCQEFEIFGLPRLVPQLHHNLGTSLPLLCVVMADHDNEKDPGRAGPSETSTSGREAGDSTSQRPLVILIIGRPVLPCCSRARRVTPNLCRTLQNKSATPCLSPSISISQACL